jgi:AraC-like DNA-binding protein
MVIGVLSGLYIDVYFCMMENVKERIEKISQYFVSMNVAEGIIYALTKFPNKWRIPNEIPIDPYLTKTVYDIIIIMKEVFIMDSIYTKDICHFIPFHKDSYSIHTINFVLETTPLPFNHLKSHSLYKMHYVCTGKGKLHLMNEVISLSPGDIFFTFPDTFFSIESEEDFTYMYISFLGSRANMIMDSLSISKQNFLFTDCREVYEFWKKGIDTNPEIIDLIAESILLYSFCFLGNRILPAAGETDHKDSAAISIKKYIDDSFFNQKLSLETISRDLSYSPKYISSVFKKTFNIGITEYLQTIRIQNACTLMKQGFTSITDVSNQCGFSDAQYFSKVFKQKMGISPKSYINSLSE